MFLVLESAISILIHEETYLGCIGNIRSKSKILSDVDRGAVGVCIIGVDGVIVARNRRTATDIGDEDVRSVGDQLGRNAVAEQAEGVRQGVGGFEKKIGGVGFPSTSSGAAHPKIGRYPRDVTCHPCCPVHYGRHPEQHSVGVHGITGG